MANSIKGLIRHPVPKQLIRFGMVGAMAAAVNFLVVVGLVASSRFTPLWANVIAFLIAFQVSYFGHNRFTFPDNAAKHKVAMSKFFIVAGLSFLLNEALFALFLKEFHLYYMLALLLVLVIVPPVTFIFSKFWAFRE